MRQLILLWGLLLCLTFLMPLLIMGGKRERAEEPEHTASDGRIKVWRHTDQVAEEMNLEDYIKGVVAAEMPASFEPEALKAQAVAARTDALLGKDGHEGCAVCTDPAHCQAWISKEQADANWGDAATANWEKISAAVEATCGEIVTYEGAPIQAVFHAQSAGSTANSEDVWSSAVPYLRAVPSEGDSAAPNFHSTVSLPFAEFCEKIRTANDAASIATPADIGEVTRGSGNYVTSVMIGGQSFTGAAIRSLFGLRSACFTIVATEETVTFDVLGYGHGVGMSQYGANYLAREGSDYKTILRTYYQGTEVKSKSE